MSLQLPQMAPGRRRATARRAGLGASLGLGLVLLAGCSSESRGEWERLAMPEPITEQGESTLALWQGAWLAALITGVVVWGLIAWVVVAYRRRSDDEIPVQTRYNLPLEIFYTVAPIMMVVVFFAHTIRVQDIVLEETPAPDNIVEVTAQKWSWTFNHGVGAVDVAANEDNADDEYPYEGYAYLAGTLTDIPTLVLPVGRDHPLQPALARRHPRLRRPRLPDQDGRHPRPGELLPGHPEDRGHLQGQVLRALRCLPLADALQRRGRQPRGVRRPRRRPGRGRRRGRRCRSSVARTHAPRWASRPTRSGGEGQ